MDFYATWRHIWREDSEPNELLTHYESHVAHDSSEGFAAYFDVYLEKNRANILRNMGQDPRRCFFAIFEPMLAKHLKTCSHTLPPCSSSSSLGNFVQQVVACMRSDPRFEDDWRWNAWCDKRETLAERLEFYDSLTSKQ